MQDYLYIYIIRKLPCGLRIFFSPAWSTIYFVWSILKYLLADGSVRTVPKATYIGRGTSYIYKIVILQPDWSTTEQTILKAGSFHGGGDDLKKRIFY